MSDDNKAEGEGSAVAGGVGVAFVATKLIDVCFYGGMIAGGPVGAAVGLGIAVGLLALGVRGAIKSGSTSS